MGILQGTPGVETSVTPLGGLLPNTISGIICLQGPTQRGEVGKEKLLATWGDFKQYFGGLIPDDDFALYCKQALEGGAKLRVARAFHFTNIDNSTVDGAKANEDLDTNAVAGVGAKVQFSISTWAGLAEGLKLEVTDLINGGTFDLIDYTGVAAQTKAAAVIAILAAINAGSATHKYVATNPSAELIVIEKPATLGVSGNGDIANITLSGTAAIADGSFKFSGGVTEYAALTSTWTAKAVGSGYNGTTIEIVESKTGSADEVDITITLPDAPLPQVITGVKRKLDARKLLSLNRTFEGVEVSGLVAFTFPLGTVVLADGVQNINSITDTDFKGSSIAKNGWHSFDEVVDSMRIFNIARPTHEANLSLAQYCEKRGDMRCRGYFPMGLTITGVDNFRNGDGPYLHEPIDSWYMDPWYAELNINDPENLENKEYAILAGGLQCVTRSLADADPKAGAWISDSGNDYGKIKGTNGMRLNLGSPGNVGLFDSIYEKGVNAIINDPSMGVVNWGNRTAYRDTSSMLSKTNIADMVVFISRYVKAEAKRMNFKPNSVQMFNLLYRKVVPFIKDVLVAGQAIEGAGTPNEGEGKWWHWIGDQMAKDLNDLKLNKRSEVDAGKYRVRFAFKPIGANEYILIDLSPTDSVTILNVSQLVNI